MITKAEAIALIEGRLEKQERVIVALDGMSCSGKTTFAAALAEKFSGSVVHMDDFFLPRDRFTEEMQSLPGGNMDRARFRAEVLEPLSRGGDFAYWAFSCAEQALLPDKVPVSGRLVVVEGVSHHQGPGRALREGEGGEERINLFLLPLFLFCEKKKRRKKKSTRNILVYTAEADHRLASPFSVPFFFTCREKRNIHHTFCFRSFSQKRMNMAPPTMPMRVQTSSPRMGPQAETIRPPVR